VLAEPSLPAARAYLMRSFTEVRAQYDAMLVRKNGYAYFFTIVRFGERGAVIIKVCEDRRGRVTGSSVVSNGEPSC
jgi:hypothetical protein